MFASIAVIASLAVATVSAAPSDLESRDIWQPCATNSLADFTLAAWNTTMPNTNTTGAPLVLGFDSAVEGAEFYVLSVSLSSTANCVVIADSHTTVDLRIVPVR